MPPRIETSDAGFTLVDAIIATAVLAGAVLALARLVTDASSLNSMARQITQSAIVAGRTLEELSSRPALEPGEAGEDADMRWAAVAMPDPDLVRVVVVAGERGRGGRAGGPPVRGATLMTVRRIRRP